MRQDEGHYRRALERGLPRWDMRSPALKAKQRRLQAQLVEPPKRDEPVDCVDRSGEAAAIIGRLKARRARFEAWLDGAGRLASFPKRLVAEAIRESAALHGVNEEIVKGRSRNPTVIAARRKAVTVVRAVIPGISCNGLGRLFDRDSKCIAAMLRGGGI